MKIFKLPRLLYFTLLILYLSGCTTLSYYAQSARGHLEILNKRIPIEDLLKTHNLSSEIANKLETVIQIRGFATEILGLPDNASYRSYVDLKRNYVVWNVFATPELSLKPVKWCFLIIGCLNYRGYFSEQAANRYATNLEIQGHDVFVGGVVAYSTLGWFDDPVLNTMLRRDNTYLARVIFHELAHQKYYVPDDTAFNEAFADAVAMTGTRLWLERFHPDVSLKHFEIRQIRENEFVDLVFSYREHLDTLFQSDKPDNQKHIEKTVLYNEMYQEYRKLRSDWKDFDLYDTWFSSGLNNAKLLSVVTYRDYLPGFLRLLEYSNYEYPVFYKRVEELGKCKPDIRHKILIGLHANFTCEQDE